MNLIEALDKADLLKKEAEKFGDVKRVQVYERRIVYEFTQCSLIELAEVKTSDIWVNYGSS